MFCVLQVAQLLKMLKVVHEEKMKSRRREMRDRARQHQAQQAKVSAARMQKQREIKKRIYRVMGQKEKKMDRKSNIM